ncbi:S41 family peptidase [Metasolibacillus meyeri]|uniref:S41 family peptidase n=1 Tax=Metasolibacillus meyeri TaxID=1071052 RepID=A0AAW9NK14_9BACL|nr:S41 family peptidase [Metasolibacillus meyeri]MEC1177765.1 S41 family peptidase [Metasolibacillus meyeri]
MKNLLKAMLFSFFLLIPITANADTLNEVKSIIKTEYVGNINGNLQKAASIEEVMDMLDAYSTFFTAAEFEQYINSIEMTSVGIGVVVEKHNQGVLITEVIEGGSAHKAGIKSGQIIVNINGQSTVPMSIQEATSLIMGEQNTSVRLGILHNGKTKNVTLVRESFSMPNITKKLLYGNVGFIHLSSFSEDAANLVKRAFNELKSQGATSFILDVQDNGGGYVDAAEQLIGMFPKSPYAYKLQTAAGTVTHHSIYQRIKFPTDTRVLVNRFSTSASEMLAAALVDQKSAVVYGEKTYGKGTMQGFFELSDGSYLKLTIGKFSGPNGSTINEIGVKPHITTATPIMTAHFDSLVNKFKGYEALSATKVKEGDSFTLRYSKPIATDTIQLIALGDHAVPMKATYKNKQLIIKPTKPLTKNAQYMLLIPPTAKEKGQYMHITVN